MKNLLLILLALFAFSCGNSENQSANEAATEGDVEIGSGEEISPQLEFETDSQDMFEVDTINSATDANNQGTNSGTDTSGQRR